MIGALQLFDMVWVMTAGGPLNASSTMAISMFKAGLRNNQMGYGSALAVILFGFGLLAGARLPTVRASTRCRWRHHGIHGVMRCD